LDNLLDPAGADLFAQITGEGIWLLGVTLAESAVTSLGFSWLWAGLLFVLVALAVLANLMAIFETLSACFIDEWPSMRQYKPAFSFSLLAGIFLVNLLMATQV